MAASPNSLSDDFNLSSAAWDTLKFVFNAVVIGVVVGGVIDFTFFHNHPAGKALVDFVDQPLQEFYDGVVKFFGFPEYARNVEFVNNEGCFDSLTGVMGPC